MRQLLIPTCLFLTAWSSATGSAVVTPQIEGFSVIEKSAQSAAIVPLAVVAAPESAQSARHDEETTAPAAKPRVASLAAPAETAEQVMLATGEDATNVEHPVVPVVKAPLRRAVSKDEVCDALAAAASHYDLPAPFFIRLIYQESGFNSQAVSRVGAQGVAQFMPAVASRMGLDDPFDPLKALHKSAQLLRTLFQQFGNFGLAAAAYNAGPKRIQDWLDKKGKLPDETRNYVHTITGRPAEQWKGQKSAAAAQRIPARAPCQREAGLLAANGPKKIPLPPARGAGTIQFASLDVQPQPVAAAPAQPAAKATKKSAVKTAVIDVAKTVKDAATGAAKTAKVAVKSAAAKVVKAAANAATKPAAKTAAKPASKDKKVRLADASRERK